MKVDVLDCTLRDGAYICESNFGSQVIKGIIRKSQDAGIDIIECGWLKDTPHEAGSSFFHTPDDLVSYFDKSRSDATYVVMIDWNRYNVDNLPICDGTSIDAIRVVFPHGKHKEGIEVGKRIMKKGYKVFFQAANTLAYSDCDLRELAECINEAHPVGISIVDTFGAMYEDDLERIVNILHGQLDDGIKIGFHSHNNQQLSFSLCMKFIKLLENKDRDVIVDSSLCGMGRGAGNAPTELIVNYINKTYHGHYDLDSIMDAIDTYMSYFEEKFQWGYSTPYFIAGMYCCHVNNIAYLTKNHRATAKEMRNIIESMSPEDRIKYDYDLLENKYIENQSRVVDDETTIQSLKKIFENRNILLLAPGRSSVENFDMIQQYINANNPIVIAVNALLDEYQYDFLFLSNKTRYNYAKETRKEQFSKTNKLLLSNIKTQADEDEFIINYSRAIKRGWEHFDNAVICCLRIMDKLHIKNVSIAGFDGFKHVYNESYADPNLPTLNPDNKWDELNEEIREIYHDFINTAKYCKNITFLTKSIFE